MAKFRIFLAILLVFVFVSCFVEAGRRIPNRRESRRNKPRKQKNEVDPDVFLEKFGYLGKPPPGVQHSPDARKQAIKNFQRMTGISVTGRLDRETRKKMAAPRCGLPDVVPPDESMPPPGVAMDPSNNPQNFYVPGHKWSKTALTWRAHNYSPDLSSSGQRRAFINAFEYWSDVSPLTFREIGYGNADIDISFGRGNHGDGVGNSFDGKGGTLAHAYYPESGDTHFDEDEEWSEFSDSGTNLQNVAAHEFGHALGLGHSNVPASLMAPYYQGYDENFQLHNDDIQGIQSIYGASVAPTPRPTSRPQQTTTRPSGGGGGTTNDDKDPCKTKFGGVLQAHDSRIYVFNKKWIWRLNDYGVDPGFPKRITKVYPEAPYNMGAAVYSWRSRYTYFFKGNKVWKFYGFSKITKKRVTSAGYPSIVQAALIGRDGLIYLLSGSDYWVFDESRMDVVNTRGRPISSLWSGVPPNIEAAVRLRDGYIYFFKGSRYRKYDEYYRQVLPGYPKEKAAPWMGQVCGSYTPK